MARITVLTFQEPGHLLPTVRLASTLRRAGHKLSYVALERFRTLLESHGFEVHPLAITGLPVSAFSNPIFGGPTGAEFWRACAGNLHIDTVHVPTLVRPAALNVLIPAVIATAPDLFVCDAMILDACIDALQALDFERLVAVRTELPIGKGLPVPELVLCPQSLEVFAAGEPPLGRQYCEPSIFRGSDRLAERRRSRDDEVLVYCSLGTQSRTYAQAVSVLRAVIAAFAGRPAYRLIVAAGDLLSRTWPSPTPSNVTLLASVPQASLLGEVDVAILHGGLGGVKEAIVADVPMLVVPFYSDQHANGVRVERNGLGLVCPPGVCHPDVMFTMCCSLVERARDRHAVHPLAVLFRACERESPASRFILSLLR